MHGEIEDRALPALVGATIGIVEEPEFLLQRQDAADGVVSSAIGTAPSRTSCGSWVR